MTTVVLIGCGKSKGEHGVAARYLYTGNLFKARRDYAMRVADSDRWFIVSALHGLMRPSTWTLPYDKTMGDLDDHGRMSWALGIASRLVHNEIDDLIRNSDPLIELHMGAEYAQPLAAIFDALGLRHAWPVQGLSIGQQLRFYAEHEAADAARHASGDDFIDKTCRECGANYVLDGHDCMAERDDDAGDDDYTRSPQ